MKSERHVIRISRTLTIPETEIEEDFVHSSGPGGQNVNKVATAVQLRFNIDESPSLTESVKQRLKQIAQNRINADGILIVESQEHRTQAKNRSAAREKLAGMIRKALKPPRQRKPTKPAGAAIERRLENKRLQAKKKAFRRNPPPPE